MFDKLKKIGILGSGEVGKSLSIGFLEQGNKVMLGTRDPKKESVQKFKSTNNALQVGTFEETAKFGDIIVFAVKGDAAESVLQLAGIRNFSNKIIIDTTNPISSDPPVNGVLKFITGPNESLMERLQKKVPDAHFVKAFNSVGNQDMYKPAFKEGKPSMFICGNNEESRKVVENILDIFGWQTIDMGKAEAARAIEPLSILWCIPGFLRNQWRHAFKLLQS